MDYFFIQKTFIRFVSYPIYNHRIRQIYYVLKLENNSIIKIIVKTLKKEEMEKSVTSKKTDGLKFFSSGRGKTKMANMVYHTIFNDDAFK
jgi:hypothetical protein